MRHRPLQLLPRSSSPPPFYSFLDPPLFYSFLDPPPFLPLGAARTAVLGRLAAAPASILPAPTPDELPCTPPGPVPPGPQIFLSNSSGKRSWRGSSRLVRMMSSVVSIRRPNVSPRHPISPACDRHRKGSKRTAHQRKNKVAQVKHRAWVIRREILGAESGAT